MYASPFTITCIQSFFSSQAPEAVSLSLVCVPTVWPTSSSETTVPSVLCPFTAAVLQDPVTSPCSADTLDIGLITVCHLSGLFLILVFAFDISYMRTIQFYHINPSTFLQLFSSIFLLPRSPHMHSPLMSSVLDNYITYWHILTG